MNKAPDVVQRVLGRVLRALTVQTNQHVGTENKQAGTQPGTLRYSTAYFSESHTASIREFSLALPGKAHAWGS